MIGLGLGIGVAKSHKLPSVDFLINNGLTLIGSGNESGLNYHDFKLTANSGAISWPAAWIPAKQSNTVYIDTNASVKSGNVTFSSIIAEEADHLFGFLVNDSSIQTIGSGALATNQHVANMIMSNTSTSYTHASWYIEGTANTTVIRFHFGSVTLFLSIRADSTLKTVDTTLVTSDNVT